MVQSRCIAAFVNSASRTTLFGIRFMIADKIIPGPAIPI